MDIDTNKVKRGRKARTIAPTEFYSNDTEAIESSIQAVENLAAVSNEYGQGRDLVNQLLGQAQAFQAAGDLLRTFGVSKLAVVKENKLYKQLAGSITPNGSELSGTWAEFCNLLGISDDKANEDIANLQAFGEEALEQMQRIGIGYRDLKKYRKLSDDQKTTLIEVAKSGDKESFVELAEELIAKHAKEKQAFQQEADEAKKNAAAKDQLLFESRERTRELVEEKNRREYLTDSERIAELETELFKATVAALGEVTVLRNRIKEIQSLQKIPNELNFACSGTVQIVTTGLVSIANDYGFSLDLAAEPEWADDDPRNIGRQWFDDRILGPSATN